MLTPRTRPPAPEAGSARAGDPGAPVGAPPARVPRPREPEVLDALLQHARSEQLARPRAARVLGDVIDRLLDERLAAAGSGSPAR